MLIIGFGLILRNDAVKFLVNDDNKKEKALKAIKQVYKYANSD